MEKISVTVKIPAIGSVQNFIVPDNMPVRNVQQLIVKILTSEFGITSNKTDLMLVDMSDGMVLRNECSFRQLDICSGAKLMLL